MTAKQVETILRRYARQQPAPVARDFDAALFDGKRLIGRVWSLAWSNGSAVLI